MVQVGHVRVRVHQLPMNVGVRVPKRGWHPRVRVVVVPVIVGVLVLVAKLVVSVLVEVFVFPWSSAGGGVVPM